MEMLGLLAAKLLQIPMVAGAAMGVGLSQARIPLKSTDQLPMLPAGLPKTWLLTSSANDLWSKLPIALVLLTLLAFMSKATIPPPMVNFNLNRLH